jgi:hypothetical protein
MSAIGGTLIHADKVVITPSLLAIDRTALLPVALGLDAAPNPP